MTALAHALDAQDRASAAPSFDEVYAAHFAFVWRVLRTFGVPDAALEDAAQDVFVVVHRRLPEFEGRAAITTWLFAIARRVAGAHRRKDTGRTEPLADEPAGTSDTFAALSRAQAAA
ncbi:MAG TPA: sigma-70 family RNA polymerase sigma factor, partial [Kofleriaceae bacterium]|nr:sigma-70 family RNA polymerase sigma factor [Kofleriaceae bacterium]